MANDPAPATTMVKNQADKQSYGNDVAATMDDGIDRNSVHRVDVDDSDNNNNNAYIIAEDNQKSKHMIQSKTTCIRNSNARSFMKV